MRIELRVLGRPQATVDGRDPADEIGAKPLALVAYLALARMRSRNGAVSGLAGSARFSRAKIAATFWPEKTDEAARYRLRFALWELRRALGKECIQEDDDCCWLGPSESIWIDAQAFAEGCQGLGIGSGSHCASIAPAAEWPVSEATANPLSLPQKGEEEGIPRRVKGLPAQPESPAASEVHLAHELSSLVGLYCGELLEGLVVREAPEFEEWLLAERERLHLLHLEALWQLADAQRAAGLVADAAQTLERLIAADPLRERSYRALMSVHARQGDRAAALRVYHRCAHALEVELGVAPSAATERLHETIAGTKRGSAQVELDRAAALLEHGQHREAWAICATAEALGGGAMIASQVALLRAEIAMRQGEQGQVLSLIQAARRAIRPE